MSKVLMRMHRPLVLVSTILATLLAPVAARADYPNKPIRLIIPFPAGGTTDTIARIVGEALGARIGQPVIPENRPGAGGNVGTALVAQAAPDGYTLAMVGNSFTVNPALYRRMPYDTRAVTPVAVVGSVPFVLVTNGASPYKTLQTLIDHARALPDSITYASGGNGTIGHLGAHWFADMAGIRMRHIPYKGGSQAMTDLLGGRVDIFFDTLITSTPFIKTGQVHPLFVTTKARIAEYPHVPTATELGFPELTFSAWVSLVAPASTPLTILKRLNTAINAALASDSVKNRLAANGAKPIGGTLDESQLFFEQEMRRWGAVVKASGAQVD